MRIKADRYRDKVVIVTGGASGIGREMCLYLARHGAVVVIADIDYQKAVNLAAELSDTGATCRAVQVDVAQLADVEKLIRETRADFGRIDILINNAGVCIDGEFKDMTLDHWKRIFDINLWGVVYGTHLVYPIMMEQGYGQIVNVSSLAGLMPGGLMTSYVATKYGVTGFSLGLRGEAAQYGIQVNALCPGFIETPFHDSTPKVSEYLNLEKNQRNKERFPTAEKCINAMMRGIARNKAVIVAPVGQIGFWWLYRLFPALIPQMWRRIIRRLKG